MVRVMNYVSGYEMKKGMDLPVLMLTARDTLNDKLKGFNSGTDDYLVKPFDFNELVVRVKALIKRSLGEVSSSSSSNS